MVAKTTTKPTGVNKGIKEGMNPEEFKSRVICKKCGKDIEFTLESQLFMKCPRCGKRVERNLTDERKESKKIIKFDILRRSKKYLLQIGFVMTCLAIAYNVTGFFTEWFGTQKWWLALMSLPLILLSYACMRTTRFKSASKKYRFFAWLALIVNCLALILLIVTAVPQINDKLMEYYEKLRSQQD